MRLRHFTGTKRSFRHRNLHVLCSCSRRNTYQTNSWPHSSTFPKCTDFQALGKLSVSFECWRCKKKRMCLGFGSKGIAFRVLPARHGSWMLFFIRLDALHRPRCCQEVNYCLVRTNPGTLFPLQGQGRTRVISIRIYHYVICRSPF